MCGWGWLGAGGELQGVWKDVCGQGGGCWDSCLVWGLLGEGLAVVSFTRGGGGGRGCRAGGTFTYGLCCVSQQNVTVSALQSAETPPSCSFPSLGGGTWPCSPPRLASTAPVKVGTGGIGASSRARWEISVPSPAGLGWDQADLLAGRQTW